MGQHKKNIEYAERIQRHIRPTGHVIGIKFLKDETEAAGMRRVQDPLTVCQFTTFLRTMRRGGAPQYMLKDDICCSFAQHVLGLDGGEDIKRGDRDVGIHFETHENFKRAYSDLTILESDSIIGMGGGLLESLSTAPDIVLFALTPGQTNRFADGYVWGKGGSLEIKFSGMCGICSNTAAKAYAEKGIVLGFPCFGGRRVGMYQDHEIAAAIHVSQLDSWLLGLDKTEATGHSYPIAFDLNKNSEGLPHYKIVRWPDVIEPALSTAIVDE